MQVSIFGFPVELDESYVDADPAAVEAQIAAYERGDRTAFDLPVSYPDSFDGRVMRAMAAVPYGETRTYGDIAAELDTSPVAVGQACGRNPVPLVVPCHRVVGTDSLGGFSADGGPELKRRLLTAEGATEGGRQTGLAAFD
ncbi:methylated-DNA--[protein]-cysteine S-methyltransferase [Halopelagius longus]|uniref:Methylated-DNA--[protein]-cysteine S-methyltransferase n=1 Tax=Halopelagius longus TaxID=1236180 RepID=A0A1H1BAR6_9EURY|nr:methylated-DNA--[protein]-cysteine S-methyltransferase [Halopelagius longus]RDI70710.1 methylated-DNA--[protein]-cysteine S-methyltransferase [Halopelagius longus]SDQ48970.1 methylated-DNA-[protein]-cysteine S-methyltransferase [Halopelagius longus]